MKAMIRIYSTQIVALIIIFTNILLAQNTWMPTSLTSRVYGVKSNSSGTIFAAGDGVYRSSDCGKNWSLIPNLRGRTIEIAKNGMIFIGTASGDILRSTDNGDTWLKIDSTLGFIAGFACSATNVLFAATDKGIFRSTDYGASWQKVCQYRGDAIAMDENSGRIYASVVDPTSFTIYVSSDNGDMWNPANDGLVNGSESITAIGINSRGHIFVGTMYNGIFRSTDGGGHWLSIRKGEWIRGAFTFKLPNQVFAGGEYGIYLSTDNGDTWGQISAGLPSGRCTLSMMACGNSVFASWFVNPVNTYTWGVSQRSDFSTCSFPPVLSSPPDNSMAVGTNSFLTWKAASLSSTFHIQVARDSTFSMVVYDTSGLADDSVRIYNLDKGTRYFWHGNATNVDGTGDWSYPRSFATGLPPPSPISPANLEKNVSFAPTLVWSRIPIASRYELQVSRQSDFGNLVFRKYTTDTTAMIDSLQQSMEYLTYFWRVRTLRADTSSDWSQVWQFTTRKSFNIPWSEDFFPLAIGNRWTYDYFNQKIWSWNLTNTFSGTAIDSIIAKSVSTDGSTVWSVLETRNLIKDNASLIVDTAIFSLVEYPDGGHRLLAVGLPTDDVVGGWRSVFQFTQAYSDSTAFFRSYPNAVENTVVVSRGNGYNTQYTATFKRSLGLVSFLYTFGLAGMGVYVQHSLKDFSLTAVNNSKAPLEPRSFLLRQNYPNPFNPSTIISFSLPKRSFVSLKIFDMIGKEVAAIVSEEMSAGDYSRQWNAEGVASGVYFYRLQSGSFVETKKLVLIR